MKYGLQVGDSLFPLGISAVELAPQDHVEIFVSHVYPGHSAATTAGKVRLSSSEAEDLAGELLSIVNVARSHQT
jgi:hypothetical protein